MPTKLSTSLRTAGWFDHDQATIAARQLFAAGWSLQQVADFLKTSPQVAQRLLSRVVPPESVPTTPEIP